MISSALTVRAPTVRETQTGVASASKPSEAKAARSASRVGMMKCRDADVAPGILRFFGLCPHGLSPRVRMQGIRSDGCRHLSNALMSDDALRLARTGQRIVSPGERAKESNQWNTSSFWPSAATAVG